MSVLYRCSSAAVGGHAGWHAGETGRVCSVELRQYLVREVWPFGHDIVVVGAYCECLGMYSCKEHPIVGDHSCGVVGSYLVSVVVFDVLLYRLECGVDCCVEGSLGGGPFQLHAEEDLVGVA